MRISPVLPILFMLLIASSPGFAQTPVRIDIDLTKPTKPVSPYIYGKNNVLPNTFLTSVTSEEVTKAQEAGVRFIRQGGGNNSTKYNWRLKLSSHPDWYNNVYANDWDIAAKTMFEKLPGVLGMWSFQLLGMAASNANNNFADWSYNQSQWWSGVAQNLAGGGQPNKAGGAKASVEGNPNLYLMKWTADSTVGILDKWFGTKGLGYDKNKIRYWSMDNEPEIWSGTHDDVMKTQCSAEEFMQLYFKVAKAARAKYPDIKLSGPVPANEWQWYRYGNDGIPSDGKKYCWLEFFIKRIAEEEKASGIRLLDVLDIHYYPETTDAAKCVQLHRVFFDRDYAYPEANGVHTVTGGWDSSINKEYILGRCSDWLTQYMGANHGVGLAVTETGMKSTNANVQAVWYASTMGEFMKNGVEVFTPWSWDIGMWETLHLFSRYNQKNYILATSQNETLISAYPTINTASDSMTVVLVNRSLTEKQTVDLNFSGCQIVETASEYLERYPGDDLIDLLGFDLYDNGPDYQATLSNCAGIVTQIATQKGKIAAVTEAGDPTGKKTEWWTKTILENLRRFNLSYVLVWRNSFTKTKDVPFGPYKGSPSEQDFVKFCKDPKTLFLKDIQ